jgi:hypothetical protein
MVARISTSQGDPVQLFGCSSDGRLTFAVRSNGKLIVAGAFAVTQLQTPKATTHGTGFLQRTSTGDQ